VTINRSTKRSGRLPGHQPENRPLTNPDSRQAITGKGPHHKAAPMAIIRAARRHVTEAAQ